MYDAEWLPIAFSIGLNREQFYKCTWRTFLTYLKGHNLKLKEKDAQDYRLGVYIQSAVHTAVDNFWNGQKSKAKYIDKPFLADIDADDNKNDYGESKEEIAVFEMKQRIQLLKKQGLADSPM